MEITIYIQLMEEGSVTYRPVPSKLIRDNLYQVGHIVNYDPEDELWEFLPDTYVIAAEQMHYGER